MLGTLPYGATEAAVFSEEGVCSGAMLDVEVIVLRCKKLGEI